MFDQLDEKLKPQSTVAHAQCICYDHERTMLDRPALWIPIVIIMFASIILLFAMADLPFGIQLASLIPYTAFVALGTFSAQRGMQPYFFECSIVRQTMPRLLQRHCNFLVALLLLETIALRLTRYMPAPWLSSKGTGSSPFAITLCVLCMFIASVQVLTNRALLERVHEKSSS